MEKGVKDAHDDLYITCINRMISLRSSGRYTIGRSPNLSDGSAVVLASETMRLNISANVPE